MLNKKLLLFLFFTGAAIVRPQPATTLYDQGVDQHRRGRNQEAAVSFQEVARLNPNFADVFNSLCVVYDELDRYREAIEACR